MPSTLNQLSDNEILIYNNVVNQQQRPELKIVNTSNEWLFKDYESIHNEYFRLHEQSVDEGIKLEALKRLIFLNWYGLLEPNYSTGIEYLNETTIFNSYKILDTYLQENKFDDELDWMLSFYSSWNFLILPFSENKLRELTKYVTGVDLTVGHVPKSVDRVIMDNRGQMGIYWKSHN